MFFWQLPPTAILINQFFKLQYQSKGMFMQDTLLSPKHINNSSFYQTFLPFNKIIITIILYLSFSTTAKDITDNTCTFKVKDKIFSLTYLNMKSNGTTSYYTVKLNDTAKIEFNFCQPFVPQQCKLANIPSSYSYLITQNIVNQTIVTSCNSFSSNSKTSNFNPLYINTKGPPKLNLTLQTPPNNNTTQKSTIFILDCDDDIDQKLVNIKASQSTDYSLLITGKSPYACPLFQISSLWNALSDNQLIFSLLMFVVGFIMLFYGILMTHLMIFLAAYFLSFAALIGIFTAFLGPDSSRIVIYFTLLFILFISTLVAYALTRLVDVSIFFIGAFLGFILAAIVNTIFIKMFAVYSIWSMVFFSVVFMIPLGLLTFKYSQQIIILSTSLAGAYMVVRPFSWIFGGFPNQFTLYQSIQNGELSTIPWTVFFYLIMILGIFVLGVLYQLLKISQRQNDLQYVNYLPDGMENRLDLIHNHVEKLINKYANNEDQKNEDYIKMSQGSVGSKTIQLKQPENVVEDILPEVVKQRKSKQNNF